nr:MAG TPA: hypothetical protein [Microviridae sp.]
MRARIIRVCAFFIVRVSVKGNDNPIILFKMELRHEDYIGGRALAGGYTPPQGDFNVSAKPLLTKLKNHSARFRAAGGSRVIGATPLISWFNFIDIFPDRACRFCDCRRHLSF